MDDFLEKLAALPCGYSEGLLDGRRYGVTLSVSADKKCWKLFAEELGGNDHVSFNLYFLSSGAPLLKPCEMAEPKVIAFVLGYAPYATKESA